MSELTSMLNIGKEMERKLISVGIKSSEELIDIGAKDAFLRLKQKYPNVCLVHLYTLEGAIHDIEYNRLSEDTKKELKEFSNFLKNISKVNFCLSDSYHCKHYKVQVFFYQPAFYTLPELQKYSIVVDREHI